jgi:hypothetical protein
MLLELLLPAGCDGPSGPEMDRAPLELCPACLEMLQWNLRFEIRSRYRRLAAIYEQVGLAAERDWIATRLGAHRVRLTRTREL